VLTGTASHMLVSLIYISVCVCVYMHGVLLNCVRARARVCVCVCVCVYMHMHMGCLHAIQKWISVNKDNETGKQI